MLCKSNEQEESQMPETKKGISLTIDKDLLIWIEDVAETEKLSISYIVNRFCRMAKKQAEKTGFMFPTTMEE